VRLFPCGAKLRLGVASGFPAQARKFREKAGGFMRYQLLKLKKERSTKPERIVAEILKRNRIKFRAKVVICGREVDFLVGNVVIEIGDHLQNLQKNKEILESGYSMLNLTNKEIYQNPKEVEKTIINWFKKNG